MGYTAILDYGAGNIKSVEKAVNRLGHRTVLTDRPEDVRGASHVILPGVGAFGDAMERLNSSGLTQVVREVCGKGVPFLGICLGLQLLYPFSEESPGIGGIGVLQGSIVRIPGEKLKVPHIGWNSLTLSGDGRLFRGVPDQVHVYFVHSYYLRAKDRDTVKATTSYGVDIDASVEAGNVFACQFHPEKSSEAGLTIIENFLHV